MDDGKNQERGCKHDWRCNFSKTRRDSGSNKSTSGAGKGSKDRDQRKLIPPVAIPVADDDDEKNHRSQQWKNREYLERGATNKPTSAITERAGVRPDTNVCCAICQYHQKDLIRIPLAPKKWWG